MTKKHFTIMASIIRDMPLSYGNRKRIANRFADFCAAENANFDRTRFLEACNVA